MIAEIIRTDFLFLLNIFHLLLSGKRFFPISGYKNSVSACLSPAEIIRKDSLCIWDNYI